LPKILHIKLPTTGANVGHQFNFNPIEKLVELFEENKNLYERLLASEKEKVDLLKDKK
jgi:hypothetical protein